MGDGSGAKSVEGPVSRLVNRPVAVWIARLLSGYEWITPNMVSVVSFLIAVVAGVLAWVGNLLVAGILVQVSSIIDGVDGSLARFTGRVSRAGGFLDTMLDRYADVVVYLGAGGWLIQSSPGLETLTLIVATLSGDLMVSYLHTRGEKDAGVHPALVGPLDYYAGRDVRLLILALGLVTGFLVEALALIAALSHFYVVVKSAALFRYMKARAGSGKD